MIRVAILAALGTVQGGCSPGDSPNAARDRGIAAASQEHNAQPSEWGSEAGPSVFDSQVSITSDRGRFTAELVDNDATRALVQMLPLTIEMRDHLRQEKTGNLPSPLPDSNRQSEFAAGTLGLWGNGDLVIYYRNGRVPQPGIIVLGQVRGDLSVFHRPGAVSVRIQRAVRSR